MSAKVYVYRNLVTGGYSVRQRGKVLYVQPELWMLGVTFQVSQGGRQRVLRTRHKNVHAYCVSDYHPCDSYADLAKFIPLEPERVEYRPYEADFFYVVDRLGHMRAVARHSILVHLTEYGVYAYNVCSVESQSCKRLQTV